MVPVIPNKGFEAVFIVIVCVFELDAAPVVVTPTATVPALAISAAEIDAVN